MGHHTMVMMMRNNTMVALHLDRFLHLSQVPQPHPPPHTPGPSAQVRGARHAAPCAGNAPPGRSSRYTWSDKGVGEGGEGEGPACTVVR